MTYKNRYIIESYSEPDTRVIRYVVVDSITGRDFDARDFGFARADFATAADAQAFRASIVADIGE